MKVDVTTLGSFQKRLAFEVPPDQVRSQLDQAYKRLATKVRLAGFRPGKAPRKILEAKFGSQIEGDVANELIQESYRSALSDHAIQPVGQPNLADSTPVAEPSGFKFTITVDVRPEVTLTKWTGMDVVYPKITVDPEEIDKAVKARLEGHAKLEEVTDRPVKSGDLALVELRVTDPDGLVAHLDTTREALVDHQANDRLDLVGINVSDDGGRQRLSGERARVEAALQQAEQLGIAVERSADAPEVANEPGTMIRTEADPYFPGLEPFVVGLSINDEKEGRVTFADTARAQAVAGRELAVKVKVMAIQSYQIPELTDELAGTLGFEGGTAGMRTGIEAQIRQGREEMARNQARANLLEVVIGANKFDVPAGMVEQSLKMLMDELRLQQAIRSGRDPRTIGFNDAQVRDLRMRAEFAAKAGLILEWVAKHEGIEVTDADIESKYKDLAVERGQTVEAVKGWFQKEEATAELKDRILEEKTLDWLLERANLVAPSAAPAPAAAKPAASTEGGADSAETDLSVLDGKIDELRDALASGRHDAHLDALLAAEAAGRNRKGAVAAIEARLAERA